MDKRPTHNKLKMHWIMIIWRNQLSAGSSAGIPDWQRLLVGEY